MPNKPMHQLSRTAKTCLRLTTRTARRESILFQISGSESVARASDSTNELAPQKRQASGKQVFDTSATLCRKSLTVNRASEGIRTPDLSITTQEESKPFRLAMNRGQLGDTVGFVDFWDGDWDREANAINLRSAEGVPIDRKSPLNRCSRRSETSR
jgi:hypothetical protein